jgi:ABC-type sugar transport system substrate-binding protein
MEEGLIHSTIAGDGWVHKYKKGEREMKKRVLSKILLMAMIVLMTSMPIWATAQKEDDGKIQIGWSANFLSHEFYQKARKGMEAKAAELGLELMITDANSDTSKQMSDIETMIAKGVDAIMITPVDSKAAATAVAFASERGIPVITESNPVEGTKTLVGANWYDNGVMIGKWTGEYLFENNITGNILLIGFPAFEDTTNVARGYKDGLAMTSANYSFVAEVDGQAMKETSLSKATDALTAHPEINVIFGINDDSAIGGILAYEAAGLDTSKLISGTHGFEGNAAAKAMHEDGTLSSGVALFPEVYGMTMVEAAYKAYLEEDLPDLYLSPMTVITQSNFLDFYSQDGNEYYLDFDKLAKADL